MGTARQRRRVETRFCQYLLDAANMRRLAAVRSAAQRQLLVAEREFVGGARFHERQRLKRLHRGAGKNRSSYVAGGKNLCATGVDDRDRAAVTAFNQAAADDFDDDRIDHVDARNFSSRPQSRCGAPILRRMCDLSAQRKRGVPSPVRIVQECARERHHVGRTFGNNGLRLFGTGDQTHDPRGKASLEPYPAGQRDIIAGLGRDARLALRADAAGGNIDVIKPGFA